MLYGRPIGIHCRDPQSKMKAIFKLVIIINLFVVIVRSNETSEECMVKEKFAREINVKGEFQWITFLTRESDLQIFVAFVNKDDIADNDEIHFGLKDAYMKRYRNRQLEGREEIIGYESLPHEWNEFFVEIENDNIRVTVNSYSFHIRSEYPIRHISIVSANMASCSEGKPTWRITENKISSIPTAEQTIIYFSIYSNNSFTPIIHMNEVSIILQYKLGVEISYHNKLKPLPEGTYEFILRIVINRCILQYKKPGSHLEVILEMKMTEELIEMGISSLDQDFLLKLTPNNLVEQEVKNDAPDTDQNSSAPNVIFFFVGVFTSAMILIVIICIKKKIKKRCFEKDIEEGSTNQHLLAKSQDLNEEDLTKNEENIPIKSDSSVYSNNSSTKKKITAQDVIKIWKQQKLTKDVIKIWKSKTRKSKEV